MAKTDIIFEDDHIIVANKPANLLTIPDRFDNSKPSLYADLNQVFGKVFIVHRLDRETSGIIVFAKNEEAHRNLSLQFEKHETQKVYLALLDGVVHQEEPHILGLHRPHRLAPGVRPGRSRKDHQPFRDLGAFPLPGTDPRVGAAG